GFEVQLHNVSIQSEEQIEIVLSSVAVMIGQGSAYCFRDLAENLTRMNPHAMRLSASRSDGSLFDQMYMFLCDEDLSIAATHLKATTPLASIVRWFVIGPNPSSVLVESLKRIFAQSHGDFDILPREATVAVNLIDRLLTPPEEKPQLAFGTKSARIIIDPSACVRSIDVLGFMPCGAFSTSNLSQFSYDEEFCYQIGQDPDFDETKPVKRRYDIDRDYFGKCSETEQELLPLLLHGMMQESLAAVCQVSLKENSQYLLIKRALEKLQCAASSEETTDSPMEIDESEQGKTEKGVAHTPVYGVLFATTKRGDNFGLAGEGEECSEGEASDDDDIDDVIEEEEGKAVRLTLALLSHSMSRPGWPDIEEWATEVKPRTADDKDKFWETAQFERKFNRWLDDTTFNREVTNNLIKFAVKREYDEMKTELVNVGRQLVVRGIDLRLIDDVVDTVADALSDPARVAIVRAIKERPITNL
ncbi:hypothetical protein PFISCL1PPCAC_17529, partial [Pristionchus fissidentatus]